VDFYLPSDRGYLRAKLARQGAIRLDSRFGGFIDGFRERFGPEPLWLSTGNSGKPLRRPRLDVVLERTRQHHAFVTAEYRDDAEKAREAARIFADQLLGADLRNMFRLSPHVPPDHQFRAEEISVSFWDFERVAKSEAHRLVTDGELIRFTSSLGLGDDLWQIQRYPGPPIVFVHTDQQAAALKASPVRDVWADDYFALVQPHDEFGYLERAGIVIAVDSKENFDNSYSSNWYYYFK
jgi:hypothetical protein